MKICHFWSLWFCHVQLQEEKLGRFRDAENHAAQVISKFCVLHISSRFTCSIQENFNYCIVLMSVSNTTAIAFFSVKFSAWFLTFLAFLDVAIFCKKSREKRKDTFESLFNRFSFFTAQNNHWGFCKDPTDCISRSINLGHFGKRKSNVMTCVYFCMCLLCVNHYDCSTSLLCYVRGCKHICF